MVALQSPNEWEMTRRNLVCSHTQEINQLEFLNVGSAKKNRKIQQFKQKSHENISLRNLLCSCYNNIHQPGFDKAETFQLKPGVFSQNRGSEFGFNNH